MLAAGVLLGGILGFGIGRSFDDDSDDDGPSTAGGDSSEGTSEGLVGHWEGELQSEDYSITISPAGTVDLVMPKFSGCTATLAAEGNGYRIDADCGVARFPGHADLDESGTELTVQWIGDVATYSGDENPTIVYTKTEPGD